MANRFAKFAQPRQVADPQGTPSKNRFARFAQPRQVAPVKTPMASGPQQVNSSGKGDLGLAPGQVAPSTYAMDAIKSAGTGLAEGIIGAAGMFGDARDLSARLAGGIASRVGATPETAEAVSAVARHIPLPIPGFSGGQSPTSADIQQLVEARTGPFYQPNTAAGDFARTTGQFASGAVTGPGGVVRKVAMTAVPAVASEAAGQLAKGTKAEPYVRAATALGAALLTGGKGNPSKIIAKGAPTREVVKEQADQLYDSLRNAGISYDADAFDRTATLLIRRLNDKGFRKAQAPLSADALSMVAEKVGKGVDFNDMDSIHKTLGAIGRERNASEADKAAAALIIETLDDFSKRAPLATNGTIPASMVSRYQKQARELAQRNIIARDIERMAAEAMNYPSGFESGMAQKLKSYLNGPKGTALRKSNPEVYRAMQAARGGGYIRNAALSLGRAGFDWSPTGSLALLLPALAGGTTYYKSDGDWAKTAAAIAGATAFRRIGKKIVNNDINNLSGVVLSGRAAQKAGSAAAQARNSRTAASSAIAASQAARPGSAQEFPPGAVYRDARGRFYDRAGKPVPAL